jgi:hypothetical protein
MWINLYTKFLIKDEVTVPTDGVVLKTVKFRQIIGDDIFEVSEG